MSSVLEGGGRVRLAFAAVLLLCLATFVARNFSVSNEITHFLPDPEDRALSKLSRQITESELSRTLILAIETPDLETSLRASRAFENALRADPRVAEGLAFLEGGPAVDVDRALFEIYEPRRLGFLASTPEAARERLTEAGLRATARSLRAELAGPLSTLAARVAPEDPFLTLPGMFRQLEAARVGGLTVAGGRFVTEDGKTAILFAGTHASALDASAQAPFLAALKEDFRGVERAVEVPIRLDLSGVHPMATRTAETIEADIKRVSAVSTAVLVCLLLLLFRSLRFVIVAAIPVVFGMLSGMATVLLLFGELHGITLAFGAALIGVSVDYVVHLYCHHSIVAPQGGAVSSLRAIFRPLATGAITTTAGFLALAASSLAGLREVACFAVVGLLCAFGATVLFVPALIGGQAREVGTRERWTAFVLRRFSALGQRPMALALLPALALGVMAWGLPQVEWNADVSSMSRLDPEILAEDERVRAKVMPFEQMRFIVALGDTDDAALAANDAVAQRLARAIQAGELGAMRSVSTLLPSPETQRAVADVIRQDAGLPARLERVFSEEGFSPGVFTPFLEGLEAEPASPVNYSMLMNSSAAALVRPFRVSLGERVGVLTFLNGVANATALEARLADLPDVLFLRQSDLWHEAQRAYQDSTARLLVIGLVAVLVLLGLRYRELRRTLISFLPSALAAGVTISVLALAGRGLDLISLTALLFVVSMGVDYSVFLVDAADEPDEKSVAAALTGALLAGVSTVAAFGLLGASVHPVLSSLGMTAAVGIGTSLLLAPVTLLLLRPDAAEAPGAPAGARSDGAKRS